MSVAALYDVHGNLPALEAVLDDLGDAWVSQLVIGGDVLPGPMQCECLDLLRSLPMPVLCIQGNGEREVLSCRAGGDMSGVPEAFRDVIRWSAEQLSSEQAEWIRGWSKTQRLAIEGCGETLFCHATPRSDTEILTRLTPEEDVLSAFDCVEARVVFCGHTHMQFERSIGPIRVVNAGSVGMPYGEPGAYWLLLGNGIELRRTTYDLEAAATRIQATGYPQASAFARGSVLDPPTEEKMLYLLTAPLRR